VWSCQKNAEPTNTKKKKKIAKVAMGGKRKRGRPRKDGWAGLKRVQYNGSKK